MKGFKKDGKFRPTGKRNKSSLTTKDLKEFDSELTKGEQMLEHRDRLKKQGASSIQHDKLILAQKKKLNKMAKEMKLKARNKESLDSDYQLFDEPYTIKKKVPTHVTMSSPDNKLPPISVMEGGSESVRDYWNNKNKRKRKDESIDFTVKPYDHISEAPAYWKLLLKGARNGEISKTDVITYYYSIPYAQRKQYGLPNKSPYGS